MSVILKALKFLACSSMLLLSILCESRQLYLHVHGHGPNNWVLSWYLWHQQSIISFWIFLNKNKNWAVYLFFCVQFIFFSGMPECKLGLNDRVLLEAQGRATKGKAIDLEDIKFHQYVVYPLFYLNSGSNYMFF